MKKILMIMLAAVILCSCQKSRTDQLESLLKDATEQIKSAKDVAQMQEIEMKTQNKIEEIMAEHKDQEMTADDAKQLGPVLNEYYQAFYEKAAEFGQGVPAPEAPADTVASEPVSLTGE